MLSTSLTAALASALVLGAAGAASAADTAMSIAAPVSVVSCALAPPDLTASTENGPVGDGRILRLAFKNPGPETLSSVTFDVVSGGQHYTVVDAGTFAQGALVEHRFFGFGANGGSADTCTVAAASYKNGTAWTPSAASAVAAK